MPEARRLDLDGLRGLAVLLVVGFHAGVPALRGAFVAVDVFFVLSGFFLAVTLTRRLATDEPLRPAELVARRVWRLLPLLAVVLLGTLATTLLYAPIDRAAVAGHMMPASVFASNLALAAGGVNYFRAGENPLLHTWTLGVELQLAVLLPFLVMLFASWGAMRATRRDESGADRRWTIVRTVMMGVIGTGAISFALAVIINDRSPMWAYFGPHTRLWAFCAGALMAFFTGGGQDAVGGSSLRRASVQFAGLALLLAPALLYENTLAYPGAIALAPVAGTMLLLAGGEASMSSLPGRLLALRPAAAIGRVSYAWYLWHWPLMVLGGVLTPGIGVAGKLAWGCAGLGAAFLTHRLLDRSTSTALIQRAMVRRPLLTAAGVAAVLVVVAAAAQHGSMRMVKDSVHRQYLAARADGMRHDCWGRSLTSRERTDRGCAFGDVNATTTIALIGDSHASHWLGALDRAGRERGWRIEPYVMGACPAADLRGLIDGAALRLYRRCERFQQETMRRIAAGRPRAVIVSHSDQYLSDQGGLGGMPGIPVQTWTAALRRAYGRLDRMGIDVIVVRDVPTVPFDVPSCLSRRAARLPFATDCTFVPDRTFGTRARRAQDLAARGLGVRFIDMNDLVCGRRPGRCATARDGMVLYSDDDHITHTFSRSLGPIVGARVAAALSHP